MGGANPYLREAPVSLPHRPYRLTIRHSGRETAIEVDPARLPYGGDGLPGSVLDIALHHGVAIDHACGGVAACSTCHVHVESGDSALNAVSEAEADQLDFAPDVRPNSRLACQCVPNGNADVTVSVPNWNRNLVREGR